MPPWLSPDAIVSGLALVAGLCAFLRLVKVEVAARATERQLYNARVGEAAAKLALGATKDALNAMAEATATRASTPPPSHSGLRVVVVRAPPGSKQPWITRRLTGHLPGHSHLPRYPLDTEDS